MARVQFLTSYLLSFQIDMQALIENHNTIRTVQSESSGVKLTRFEIEGWLELIGISSVNILHQSDCAWPCCLSSQL